MTELTLTPGCYGSAVMYRAGSPECDGCPLAESCLERVRETEKQALNWVMRLDDLFKTELTADVAKWFRNRSKVQTVTTRSDEHAKRALERWKSDNVNAFEVQHGYNPANAERDPMLYAAFDFVIKEGPFKPRDLSEHLRDTAQGMSKRALASYVTEFCDALAHLNIIKREARGVLCLQ